MNRISTKLSPTSQSWIASIVLVLNLVDWTGQGRYWLLLQRFSNDASNIRTQISAFLLENRAEINSEKKITSDGSISGQFSNLK